MTSAARAAIRDPANAVYVSLVSAWELALKASIARLDPTVGALVRDEPTFVGHLADSGFELLPLGLRHVFAAAALPSHHRDPFDRMLIAQARTEGLTLVTADGALSVYDVPILAT